MTDQVKAGQMLQDKVILVTGAGRGVGRDIALLAASQGAKVVVNDLGGEADGEGADKTPAMEVVGDIKEAGGEAVANYGSVADFDTAQEMVQQAVDTYGRIDGVVNNAGILRDVIFHKMTEADWDIVIAVHLKGSFNVARAAATHFREQQSGAFVHMTSTSGLVGNFGQANYAAAKLGIVGLSKSLALDMSRFNVRSNCISPFAWSRLIGTIPIADDAQAARVEKIKAMTPAKIAPMAGYLLSDAASEVSGQIFGVRHNEIFLFGHPRPVRSVQRGEGWTPETIAEHAIPAMQANFAPLERSQDVFSWDPV
jgi:NAD(P)-dependent dehydrogenase (short-subunit alcohol dehydrogenase family)